LKIHNPAADIRAIPADRPGRYLRGDIERAALRIIGEDQPPPTVPPLLRKSMFVPLVSGDVNV
jgi:nitrogen-specific signal transduction histidine kinase